MEMLIMNQIKGIRNVIQWPLQEDNVNSINLFYTFMNLFSLLEEIEALEAILFSELDVTYSPR
jgi:hypothetical protein